MNIPNILTTFRVFLVPVFVYFFFSDFNNNYIISAFIFMLAGITDILDGYIARKYNMITKWGKLLDPLADKFMQLTVIVCLAYKDFVPLWAIYIILIKEVLMIIGGILLYKDKIVVPANSYGKVATTLFYFSILMIIFFEEYLSPLQNTLLIIIVLASTILAFLRYTVNFKQIKYPHRGVLKDDENVKIK